MSALNRHRGIVWLAVGLVVGLVLGGLWPQAPLHAVATDRYENFAICTGPVDEEVEAIYFLDFLTGNVRAAVLNVLNGRFTAAYEHNVMQDLGVDPTKNPRYMMVTGLVNLRRFPGIVQPSASCLYVAEVTSGKVAAYSIPWARGQAKNVPIQGDLKLLDVVQFRTAAVRAE